MKRAARKSSASAQQRPNTTTTSPRHAHLPHHQTLSPQSYENSHHLPHFPSYPLLRPSSQRHATRKPTSTPNKRTHTHTHARTHARTRTHARGFCCEKQAPVLVVPGVSADVTGLEAIKSVAGMGDAGVYNRPSAGFVPGEAGPGSHGVTGSRGHGSTQPPHGGFEKPPPP